MAQQLGGDTTHRPGMGAMTGPHQQVGLSCLNLTQAGRSRFPGPGPCLHRQVCKGRGVGLLLKVRLRLRDGGKRGSLQHLVTAEKHRPALGLQIDGLEQQNASAGRRSQVRCDVDGLLNAPRAIERNENTLKHDLFLPILAVIFPRSGGSRRSFDLSSLSFIA
uniref:Uncharacterized protein n=1 Tax=Thermogemmatispora argillosa TaxID=2045280 RepID=A0A455SUT3_9CHLR|nr:hypothetical protein KTA_03820 [Thermogemmatispora argillosa]